MNHNFQQMDQNAILGSIQPKKIIEHFGEDINEIKRWAEFSTEKELLVSINAFEAGGYLDYVPTLQQVLTEKRSTNG
jgi:hypothetical protein